MTGQGYVVDSDALRRFGKDLENFQNTAARLTEKLGGADVTDASWGVVGWAVKEVYDRVLGESQGHMGDLRQRISEAADLLIRTANEYSRADVDTEQRIADITGALDGGARHG
jgi:excreted virulence factor EspC (type VII ESX diderm)